MSAVVHIFWQAQRITYNKDYSILGSILGSPYFGKLAFGVSKNWRSHSGGPYMREPVVYFMYAGSIVVAPDFGNSHSEILGIREALHVYLTSSNVLFGQI